MMTLNVIKTLLLLTPAWSAPTDPPCAWLFVRDPSGTPPSCEQPAFPPRTADQPFQVIDEVHGIRLEDALASGGPTPPPGLDRPDFPITRPIRAWGLRNVAHHLGRMHEFLRLELRRDFPSRPLTVTLVAQHTGMGRLIDSKISLGGYGELTSEVIFHEYGHHVIEWERPGLMSMRDRAGRDPEGPAYGLVEAWCNHLAFALDEEPRFSEYLQQIRGTPQYAYSVDTTCTQRGCDQAVFGVDSSFQAVILFGGLLWDLHRAAGARVSTRLMLDSLQFIDPHRDTLDYRTAIRALLQADRALYGSRWQTLLSRQAAARFPDVDIL